MSEETLSQLINGCLKQDRKSQKLLYKAFYGFSMSICMRYVGNRQEAAEVMNQGFFKVFTNIDRFDETRSFQAWLGRIMMNVAIDYYRANSRVTRLQDINYAEQISSCEAADKNLNYHDLLALIQKLPQAYRTVFNLFAIDGYSHEEIGKMLNINIGTSKSNLFKARQKLQQMVLKTEQFSVGRPFFGC
ncbi:RNA polymerase sigma factor [Dyadobacter frigoris]|uniref:Sigma-70 family RNA polymerase sigma factor n=1 Tax=Dyadobacter frigoris TaxID=2576211 RepID=A0A4U6D1W1_9BACT|nr:sigma-70 family RNA polymerase sigma factor [Dyadobacter frigoris]TKT90616.1 sigma-70 family RNA polymerase sigma factor [Dyadobacter frigoris]GLU51235.1 DNA-directed RNA polymerase sigma-70 factor [Dyadobacter frigoris]